MKQKQIILVIAVLIVISIFVLTNALDVQKKDYPHTNNSQPNNYSSALDSIPTQAGKNLYTKQSNNLTTSVDPELVDLDSQIITCDNNVDGLLSSNPSVGGSCLAGPTNLDSIKGKYLGGQCCGVMTDTTERHENLEKLQAYKSMPGIPLDPMHTPVDMAKRWIDYDDKTTLTPDQQKIYDEAFAISKEKPCCCKCWHYYVNEGIAKKMIMDGQFNSKQIADFWDASDICGT